MNNQLIIQFDWLQRIIFRFPLYFIIILFSISGCNTVTVENYDAPEIQIKDENRTAIFIEKPENNTQPDKPSVSPSFQISLVIPGRTSQSAYFAGDKSQSIAIEGALLKIPAGALPAPVTLSVTGLLAEDLPALPEELINVTKSFCGYRFLPHGTIFKSVANIEMSFDESLLPEGFTADDVHIWYYNDNIGNWEALARDSVSKISAVVYSETYHFTDMIAGVVRVPESPETSGYVPTTFKNRQFASPSEGISQIAPPKATSRGDAEITFPLTLPAGRGELEPQLELQYSSNGNSSWTGFGWDLSLPNISVDINWGVPRYDNAYETETYLLDGMQLTPLAHRSDNVARTPEKRFYSRVESDYRKVIRHGSAPDNYWWEVVDKKGTRSFYGGKPEIGVIDSAVSRNTLNKIGFWALTEMRDVYDNFVIYKYNKPLSCRQKLYPAEIVYTGHDTTKGAYCIRFVHNETANNFRRKDVRLDARLGFLQYDSFLLKRIDVTFQNKPVRSYALHYQEGAFCKSLLKSISVLDDQADTFYRHRFEYYDDIEYNQGYKPYTDTVYFTPPDDKLSKSFLIPAQNPTISILGASESTGLSGTNAATFGFDPDASSKSTSVGGNFTYILSDANGMLALIDMDSDGMLDKVFREGKNIYYRPNLGIDSVQMFGEKKLLKDVKNISSSFTLGYGTGPEVSLPLFIFGGYNYTKLTTWTNEYFSDYNADGIVDYIDNGQIRYGFLNNGGIEFTDNIEATPNPVRVNSLISTSMVPDAKIRQGELEKQFPLLDAVRMWQAPYTGRVKITAPVSMLKDLSREARDYTMKDGVRVSIQWNDSILWSTSIGPDDNGIKNPNIPWIDIGADDTLFFRVQSVFNGMYDQVSWDPEIVYLSMGNNSVLPLCHDVNQHVIGRFKASEDFVLCGAQNVIMPDTGWIRIKTAFSKSTTSDSLKVEIRRVKTDSSSEILRSRNPDCGGTSFSLDYDSLQVLKNEVIFFRITSLTNIDWSGVNWQTEIEFHNKKRNDQSAEQVLHFKVVPEFTRMYNKVVKNASLPFFVFDTLKFHQLIFQDSIDNQPHRVKLAPILNCNGKSFVFSVKRPGEILARKTVLPNDSVGVIMNFQLGDSMYFEMDHDFNACALPALSAEFRDTIEKRVHTKSPVTNNDTIILKDTLIHNIIAISNLNVNSAYNPAYEIFGKMFRGWGQFTYNGAGGRDTLPINRNLLKLNLNQSSQQGYNNIKDPMDFTGQPDPTKDPLSLMVPHAGKMHFMGIDTMVYINGSIMSASRQGMKSVYVKPMDYTKPGLKPGPKITEDEADSYAGGLSTPIGGASYSESDGNSRVINDVMDMNGDKYPDILSNDKIQYTGHLGGLINQYSDNDGLHVSESHARGFTVGGRFVFPKSNASSAAPPSKSLKTSSGENSKLNRNSKGAEETSKGTLGLTLAPNFVMDTCVDYATQTWIDINGDGLPDKVYNDGRVKLNLGYSFDAGQIWNFGVIRSGKTSDAALGGGGGLNYGNNSIMAGVSYTASDYFTRAALTDVNGDGLPDLLQNGYVSFNTGSGFDTPIKWDNNLEAFDKGVAIGESYNGGFTIGIPFTIFGFPFKFCINPTNTISRGFCKTTSQLMDIDGDGMPDYLQSNKETELKVRLSKLGCTNMLKTVKLPLGGEFSIGYAQTASTYDHPGGQWALQSVQVYDGLKGDGADTALTTFEFKNGFYNRRERQFYGFDTVRTFHHNTRNNNQIYRVIEQVYNNDFYYSKGLLLSSTILDGNRRKQKGIENFYSFMDIHTGNVVNAENETQPLFVALGETRNLSYGGSLQPQILTRQTYSYDTLGNLISYTDSASGKESDRITVNIRYHKPDHLYVCSVPASHEVFTADGLMRKSTTEINGSGSITKIEQLIDSQTASYDIDYDKYGNIIKLIRPQNHNGERMFYSYTYDTVLHALVTKVTDAYGYSSFTRYNLKWQLPDTVSDINGEKTAYTYDRAGRPKTVTGPYEIAAGMDYSMKYEYHHDTVVPYARTLYYDSTFHFIETYLFTDGTGRKVQLKKTAELFSQKDKADILGFVVSGSVHYDAFGRAEKVYQPVFANSSSPAVYNSTLHKVKPSEIKYDILNRPVKIILPDNTTTVYSYGIGNYKGEKMFIDSITDANGNVSVKYTGAGGEVRAASINTTVGDVLTTYDYNPLNELLSVTDAMGSITTSEYDKLGRRTSIRSSTAGLTELFYDKAGNLVKKITAGIRQQMPDTGAIHYRYHFGRLVEVVYPKNIQNRINYTYGAPGEKSGRAGRIKLIEDAGGGQEFFYGRQGEIVKTIRTVQLAESDMRTWIWTSEYDTWNRIRSMTYPDGEKLTYFYNSAGNLKSMQGAKLGRIYNYVSHLGYDEQERQVFLQYGNNTFTTFNYESDRQRISNIEAYCRNSKFMANEYKYDALNNILKIIGAPDSIGSYGGNISHLYTYDELNRITQSSGIFKGSADTCKYALSMQYDKIGNILEKSQSLTKNGKEQKTGSYNAQYSYLPDRPNVFKSVGSRIFRHDLNGNQIGWEDTITNDFRHLAWDEENRLTFISDNGYVNRYVYDATGERVIKSHGGSQGIFVNGAPAGIINHSDNNYVVYVNPYFVLRNDRFTKHYYAGNVRLISKVGNGQFNNQFRPGVFEITAGGVNFINRQQQLKNKREEHYKKQGIPPGPPTMKGISGEPEFTNYPIPDAGTPFSQPPAGWPRKPYFAPAGGPPGAPVQWGDTITNESVEAGFGYNGTGTIEEELRYFFHIDHVGSTNYITDANGNVKQFIAYMPFGEIMYEKQSSWATSYKFNAREQDSETSLYYYGTRYYDPALSRWLNIHPDYFKAPETSPFAFCNNNPVVYSDINSERPLLATNPLQKQLAFIDFNALTAGKLSFMDSSLNQFKEVSGFADNNGSFGNDAYFMGENELNASEAEVDAEGDGANKKGKTSDNKSASQKADKNTSGQSDNTKPIEMDKKHVLSSGQKTKNIKAKVFNSKISKPEAKYKILPKVPVKNIHKEKKREMRN